MTAPEAKRDFKRRVGAWADRLEVEVRSVALRTMRTKWASCSTRGRLTFDTALLEFEEAVQNYVIVHELLHVHVPNHGGLWKSLMRAHLGQYEELDLVLRRSHEPHRRLGGAGVADRPESLSAQSG